MAKPIKESCPNCGAARAVQTRYFVLHALTEDSQIADREMRIDTDAGFPVSVVMCKECGLIELVSATINPKPIKVIEAK